ncbi:winged helix DNA-binding domain-containing protein [Dacryopinax primogenitus]|uniref:Vacuolar-sorting protein SNF8 n=1 Tax=Dacryopinax primogenitus (strain DJM 731) TaxID=1858805 RepID=M5GGT8_DACPD|nr:winged helix DNA-binding domain-containing protein [Dacryopinax primogenitus]EJU06063.1 winged helix DNA-binding domain-containing protein [Dacryopinax primogenitus]
MHRLGGAGIGGLQRQTQATQAYKPLSSAISRSQIDSLQQQLATFREALTRFAREHRNDIRRNPEFRQQFQQMCAAIGVDPLAGPRKGGWWAELIGYGDWTYELAIQIVEICVNTRDINGGLIEMDEVLRMVRRLRALGEDDGSEAISEEDIVRSVHTLSVLGAGYQIVTVGHRKMLRIVPQELDTDQAAVLEVAQEAGGQVNEGLLVLRKKWTVERARTALENMLMRDGLCWIDDQAEEGIVYWVPSVMIWAEE